MTIEQDLDRCLDDMRLGGATIEECLARYREHANELRPLLELAARLERANNVHPTREFKARLRKQIREEPEEPNWLLIRLRGLFALFLVFGLVAILVVAVGLATSSNGTLGMELQPSSFFVPMP